MDAKDRKLLTFALGGAAVALLLWLFLPLILSYRSYESRIVTPRGDLATFERVASDVFKSAAPSVVYIFTEHQGSSPFGAATQRGTGSGFVWDQAGHVITNHHVVAGADRVFVRIDAGNTIPARLVGASPDHDLAVLKVSSLPGRLQPLPLGTSADLVVGQSTFAIGNPFGLARSLSAGIVSALDRSIPAVTNREITGVIQTDAAINPGNSGGPLLDSAGRLVGVNTAIYSQTGSYSGIGFAIPVDTVNRIVPQLIAKGAPARPGIGIRVMSDEIAARLGTTGVVVAGVVPDSPAAKAGLVGVDVEARRLGDVIIAVDGTPVATFPELARQIEKAGIGKAVRLTVERAGSRREVTVPVVDVGSG